jgi:glycosyltransferase involved in cell wall biosynthesis
VKTVRIGFDASVASGQPGGTGTYAVQLMNALIPMRPDWTFFLYFRRPDPGNPLMSGPIASNVHRIVVPGFTNSWRIQAMLPRQLARDRIDLYHSPGYFLPLRWGGRKVLTIHDLNMYAQARNWMRPQKFLAWLDLALETPLSARSANRIIAVSSATAMALRRILRVPSRAIRVIHDGFFDEPASPSEMDAAARLAGGRPYILFVGILSPQKNLVGLIRAFNASNLAASGVELVLAGADHEGYARHLRAVADRTPAGEHVRLVGYVPRPTLRGLYAGALCLVQPSHGEGFGLPMVEAMAAGTPVLAANRQALPEVLGGGGALFEPAKLGELSALLARVAQDSALRATLAARARTRRRDFSWVKTAQATAEVYEEVLRGS